MNDAKKPGCHMSAEIAQAPKAFENAATQNVSLAKSNLSGPIYTVARGSSDAVANILSYEFMRETGRPMTSLPPSVFSIGNGVNVENATVLIVSQSGASDDLVRSAKGAVTNGANVFAITNVADSPVEQHAVATFSACAGIENAVPATKTVIGSIGAGMALLSALQPDYAARAATSAAQIARTKGKSHPKAASLRAAMLRADHVYVIGRDTGYGAAHEVALKLKECCALHAEAYSSSEVLHGPLQLATNPLMVLILDTGEASIQSSLDEAEARFAKVGCDIHRVHPTDIETENLTPAAAAACLLYLMYPIIHDTALALGMDPDAPATLSKVTQTT